MNDIEASHWPIDSMVECTASVIATLARNVLVLRKA